MDKKIIYGVVFLLSLLLVIILTSGTTDCGPTSNTTTTCGAYGCLYIQDSTTNTRAIFDGGGFIDIEGGLNESNVGTPNGNDFIIQNSGSSTVLWIDDATGALRTAGTVSDDQQSYCTPPANSFVIRDISGNCVAYVNSTGDIWARGRLCYNAGI